MRWHETLCRRSKVVGGIVGTGPIHPLRHSIIGRVRVSISIITATISMGTEYFVDHVAVSGDRSVNPVRGSFDKKWYSCGITLVFLCTFYGISVSMYNMGRIFQTFRDKARRTC